MSMLLSVGIPALKERREKLSIKLDKYRKLLQQQGLSDCVEILVEEDNRELPIGQKRNNIVNRAKGQMLSFVDDDDSISDDYFSLIVQKIKQQQNLDAISILSQTINVSNQRYNHYVFRTKTEDVRPNIQFKPLTIVNFGQLNPIRLSLIKQVMYPNIRIHEDLCFSKGICPYIKTHSSISHKPIYTYFYDTTMSAVQDYRKPKSEYIQRLCDLFLNEKELLEYDKITGVVTDVRYHSILKQYGEAS